jgi:CRP-like cAMP-binding protein
MAIALIGKLERFTRLSGEDRKALERIASERVRRLGAHEDIILEGDKPEVINVVLSGWACRYKQLEDGRRQIISFFLPGDLFDHNIFIVREMDHSVGTITPVAIAEISREAFENLTLKHPRVTQALWWESLVSAAIQREWTVNLGQRNAAERMSHLFCELFLRLQSVGLAKENSCEFPVTQVELADATGLSAVHVNRTLRDLREANLIEIRGKILTIPDLNALMRAALFNTNYLHLDREGLTWTQIFEAEGQRESAFHPSGGGGEPE